VRASVLDITGRRVAALLDEDVAAGRRELTWEPRSLAAGVYFLRLETAAGVETRPVLLTR
jgi:hypothetical protein